MRATFCIKTARLKTCGIFFVSGLLGEQSRNFHQRTPETRIRGLQLLALSCVFDGLAGQPVTRLEIYLEQSPLFRRYRENGCQLGFPQEATYRDRMTYHWTNKQTEPTLAVLASESLNRIIDGYFEK